VIGVIEMSDMKDEPAFPSTSYWDARYETYRPPETNGGMSLRDYFAAKAMVPLISKGEYRIGMGEPSKYDQIAEQAKLYAEAMIRKLK
jgi:hypothetical protein